MKLDESEKNKIINRYTGRYEKYGYAPETLGWGKGGRQSIRFDSLTGFLNLREINSILDIGCGFADLYQYLINRNFEGEYLGVELVRNLAEEAVKRYPAAEIIIGDFNELEFDREFDLVVGSGIYNARCAKDMYKYIYESLDKMISISNVVAVDFMSSFVDFQRDIAFHAEPSRIINIVRKIKKRFIIKYDYMPYEYSVIIFNDDTILPNNVFIENKFAD